jgi:hypothetical protein
MDSMDTLDTSKTATGHQAVNVDDKLALIKREMPKTYATIQAAAGRIGSKAFEQVRRGIRGEARCFFALEGDHHVGEPWDTALFGVDQALLQYEFGRLRADVRLAIGVQNGQN